MGHSSRKSQESSHLSMCISEDACSRQSIGCLSVAAVRSANQNYDTGSRQPAQRHDENMHLSV